VSAEARLQRGIESFGAGRFAEAAEHFRAATELRRDYADAHNNLGLALYSLGRRDEAAHALRAALAINPRSVQSLVALGRIALENGDFEGGIEAYSKAFELAPSDLGMRFLLAAAHSNHGLSLQDSGSIEYALAAFARAVELAPDNPIFTTNLRLASSQGAPMWHFSMMNDAARNDAFDRGIRKVVGRGGHVLDIGTGAGLLAMMAARAGAGRVTTCEMVPTIASKAREIIAANGYADKIHVVGKKSTGLEIPADMKERADVLIAEILASDILGEGLLESYEDARARLLRPDARILPSKAWALGQLASAEGIEDFVRVEEVAGFALDAFNQFAPVKVHPGEIEASFEALSDSFEIFAFDLQATRRIDPEERRLAPVATRAGRCVGILQWIRLELAPGISYENSPAAGIRRAGHWQQVLHLFEEPIELERGEEVPIVAAHNRHNLFFRLDT
jgi:protein arginine N-methyltransferase 7